MKGYLLLLSLIALSAASNSFLRDLTGEIAVTVNSMKTTGNAKCTDSASTKINK